MRAEFYLAEMKDQWDEGGGRILLDDNTGEGAVMLRPIRFQCLEFSWSWISWTPLYIHIELTICLLISDLGCTFRNVNCCVRLDVSVFLADRTWQYFVWGWIRWIDSKLIGCMKLARWNKCFSWKGNTPSVQNTFRPFMEFEDWFLPSHEPSIGLCSDKMNPINILPLCNIHFNIILPTTPAAPVCRLPLNSRPKLCADALRLNAVSYLTRFLKWEKKIAIIFESHAELFFARMKAGERRRWRRNTVGR
jgi:hypothetical protein